MSEFPARTVRALRTALNRWYRVHRRDLPWRGAKDPYQVVVSEFMLQQTQVATVLPYYSGFLAKFPSFEALADAPEESVRAAWTGLGYYRRARNLQATAAAVVRDHAGTLPRSWEALRSLPGVGDYTASALASIVHGLPHGVVDGNVIRVLTRLAAHADPVHTAKSRRFLQELADRLVDPANPGDWNQAVMELGARVCTPRNPQCDACPWRVHCAAVAEGNPARYPVKARPARTVEQHRVVGVIRKGAKVLLVKRNDPRLLDGTWELPGCVVEPGQDPAHALRTALRVQFDGQIRVHEPVASARHSITNRRIKLQARGVTVTPLPRARREVRRWVDPQAVPALPMSSMTLKVLRSL